MVAGVKVEDQKVEGQSLSQAVELEIAAPSSDILQMVEVVREGSSCRLVVDIPFVPFSLQS